MFMLNISSIRLYIKVQRGNMRTLFRVCFLILLLAIIEIVCAGISALGVLICAGHSAFTLKKQRGGATKENVKEKQ